MCFQIVSKLKEEIVAMEKEHSELQEHIGRTDWWCENLGRWRAAINTAEVTTCHVAAKPPRANTLRSSSKKPIWQRTGPEKSQRDHLHPDILVRERLSPTQYLG